MKRAEPFLACRAMSAEDDAFHRLVVGQHRDQHLGIHGGVVWRASHTGALSAQLVSAAAGAVVYRQLVPGPSDVPRHRLSHIAEPDESDVHAIPFLRGYGPPVGARFALPKKRTASSASITECTWHLVN